MRAILLALTVTAALVLTGTFFPSTSTRTQLFNAEYSTEVMTAWSQWKQTHAKLYGTESDESYRLSNFAKHFQNIKAANANPAFTFKSALNKFSDLSVEEFQAMYTGYKHDDTRVKNTVSLAHNYRSGTSKDWSAEGAVTPVKDQGACGSCWAFSATGALEGLDYLLNGTLRSFSEQMFLLCDKKFPNMGCNGGNSAITMMWTEENGVVTEERMPYTATDTGTCYWNKYNSIFFNKDMNDVPHDDNTELVAAVDRQPISIAVAANKFMHYSSGIFNDWTCLDEQNQINHAILLVGYAGSGSDMYWKVKNSWGTSWGESGYIKMARHTTKSEVGICGITSAASYPTGQNEPL